MSRRIRLRLTDLPAHIQARIRNESGAKPKRPRASSAESEPNETLALHIRTSSLVPAPVREYRFHPDRRWQVDFAWPDYGLFAEVEGGTWIPGGGRHNRGRGFEEDCRKYLAAFLLGFTVVRFTTAMVNDLTALQALEAFFQKRTGRDQPLS